MTADYYAILGVAPNSEDVVIRAAYVALMRRYHPDTNSSPAAVERAKAITVAYAVLSDRERRIDYDRARRDGDPYPAGRDNESAASDRFNKAQFEKVAILAAVLMLLLLPLYLIRYPLTIAEPPGTIRAEASRRSATRLPDPAQSCISRAAHDLLQQQLLRRASAFRGRDRAEFDRIMSDSFVRIDSTVAAEAGEDGTVDCSALVVVLLPPGTATADGRRSLTAELDFSLTGTADGGRPALRLAGADAMARQLATLTRLPRPADDVEPLPLPAQEVPVAPPARLPPIIAPTMPAVRSPPAVVTQPVRTPRVAAPAVAATRPQPRETSKSTDSPINASFNCKFAKGRGETTVCGNRNLATLDRQLAVLYGQSWGLADAAKRADLLRTREQFIARRDDCRSDSCAVNVYLGRMREVTEIMARPSKPR